MNELAKAMMLRLDQVYIDLNDAPSILAFRPIDKDFWVLYIYYLGLRPTRNLSCYKNTGCVELCPLY